ncbi:response regulator transcription factor [Aliarcobacter butzleri]|uniref:response regulator transcription factor n=1 Tax=Aliarcobacter butzleri TaxID=28197 RepID=UPI00125FF281|nr:response regulator transcription factor [Aliarcobacter butzleri]MCG3660875.1 response regulator transcription factor [Aliarcobacter butzleri]MCG3714975.1 response regulator transcription factor [Aliarcobacter butzleri]MDK2064773.1 response regulator transcription factor [Aliarcobacter butzleri]
MINILMIEDDTELANILVDYLKQYDIEVMNYETPELGVSALSLKKYDLIILDLSLPNIDGIEVCRLIRQRYDIPIIISSARSDLDDKIACFSSGADDFMPKPYDTQELILRIQSILKRYNHQALEKEVFLNRKPIFTCNESKMEIYQNDKLLDLTNAEFFILQYLISRAGFVVSRQELLSNVDSIKYESSYKSIDVLIGRVRAKTEENTKNPKYILSIRGVGYKLVNQ